jgi:palmitoyl-protein thioesterase
LFCCLQDPLQIDAYLRYNIFLPDINNERDDKNTNYADNLAALQRLVLFRFDEDTTGGPKLGVRCEPAHAARYT